MTNNTPRDSKSDNHITWLYKSGKTKQDIITDPIFYMVDASHYDPREETRMEHNGYAENIFCQTADSNKFNPAAAMEETEKLRELLVSLDTSVILGPGRAGQLDGVFTRDAGMSFMTVTRENNGQIQHIDMKTLTANFHHHKRHEQGETHGYMEAISFLYHHLNEDFDGPDIGINMHQIHFDKNDPTVEFGDFMYVPSQDILIAGHKPAWATEPHDGRTDIAFHDIAAKRFGLQGRILPIEVDNGFFHADTSMKWLPNGKVIAYENGMSRQSFNRVVKAAGGTDNIIQISKMDAMAYAANSLVVNDQDIIMPSEVSKKLVREIEKSGIKVHTTPLSQFTEQSGGGSNCLTNRLNNFRRPKTQGDDEQAFAASFE